MGCGSSTAVNPQQSRSILPSEVERQSNRLTRMQELQLDTERRQLCHNLAFSVVLTSPSQPQSSGDMVTPPSLQQHLPHLTIGSVHMPHNRLEQRPGSENTRPAQYRAPPRRESAIDLLESPVESSKSASNLSALVPPCGNEPLLPLNAQINFDQPEGHTCLRLQTGRRNFESIFSEMPNDNERVESSKFFNDVSEGNCIVFEAVSTDAVDANRWLLDADTRTIHSRCDILVAVNGVAITDTCVASLGDQDTDEARSNLLRLAMSLLSDRSGAPIILTVLSQTVQSQKLENACTAGIEEGDWMCKKNGDNMEDLAQVLQGLPWPMCVEFDTAKLQKEVDSMLLGLETVRSAGYQRQEVLLCGALGMRYHVLDQFEGAVNYHKMSLKLARELNLRAEEGKSLCNLAACLVDQNCNSVTLGQFDHIVTLYEQALAIARSINDQTEEIRILAELAVTYESANQVEKAVEMYKESLQVLQNTSDMFSNTSDEFQLGLQGKLFSNLGVTYSLLKQFDKAVRHHEMSLEAARLIGDIAEEARVCCNLGSTLCSLGQFDKALVHHKHSFEIARKENLHTQQARAIQNMILTYESEPDNTVYKAAAMLFRKQYAHIKIRPKMELQMSGRIHVSLGLIPSKYHWVCKGGNLAQDIMQVQQWRLKDIVMNCVALNHDEEIIEIRAIQALMRNILIQHEWTPFASDTLLQGIVSEQDTKDAAILKGFHAQILQASSWSGNVWERVWVHFTSSGMLCINRKPIGFSTYAALASLWERDESLSIGRNSRREVWCKGFDPTSEDVFYFNTVTHQSSWDAPPNYDEQMDMAFQAQMGVDDRIAECVARFSRKLVLIKVQDEGLCLQNMGSLADSDFWGFQKDGETTFALWIDGAHEAAVITRAVNGRCFQCLDPKDMANDFEAMSLIKETPRVFNYGLGQVSGDLNYHDVDSIHSSTEDSDVSSSSADDFEDETEQGPPLCFNEQLQDHTESIEPSGTPRDAAASSVKALRSSSPALDNAKMQEIYEEHKRWIVAGELERLVTAQLRLLGQKIPDDDKGARDQMEEGLARSLEHAMSRLQNADRQDPLATTDSMMQDVRTIACDAVDSNRLVETPSRCEPSVSEKKSEEDDADVQRAVDQITSEAQGAVDGGMPKALHDKESKSGAVDAATLQRQVASDLAAGQSAVAQECAVASQLEVAPDPKLDPTIGHIGVDYNTSATGDNYTSAAAGTSEAFAQVQKEDALCSSTGILLGGTNDGLEQKVTKAFEASTSQIGVPMGQEAMRHMTQSFLENMGNVLEDELRSMLKRVEQTVKEEMRVAHKGGKRRKPPKAGHQKGGAIEVGDDEDDGCNSRKSSSSSSSFTHAVDIFCGASTAPSLKSERASGISDRSHSDLSFIFEDPSDQAKNGIKELTAVERPRMVMHANTASKAGLPSAASTPHNAADVLPAGGSGPVGDGGAQTTTAHNLPRLQEEEGAKNQNEGAAPFESESEVPDDVQTDKGTVSSTNSLVQMDHEQQEQAYEEHLREAEREADAAEREFAAAAAEVEAEADEAAERAKAGLAFNEAVVVSHVYVAQNKQDQHAADETGKLYQDAYFAASSAVAAAIRHEDSGAATAVDNAATLLEEIHVASTEAAAVVAAATIAATEREPIHMPPKEEPLPPASVFSSSNLIQIVDKRREAAAKMKQRMQQASNGVLSPVASRQAPESMHDGHLPLKNKNIVNPGLENTGSRVEEDSFQYKMKASVFFDADRGVVFQGQARPSPEQQKDRATGTSTDIYSRVLNQALDNINHG